MKPKWLLLCYWIFFFISYSVINSYVSFLMRLIEIIKTLILLFILLHLYRVAITRLAEGCTPLLWPQLLLLPVLWTTLKLKIDKKTKRSCYCFCSYSILLIIIYTKKILNSDWLRKECNSCTFVGLWKIYSCLFIPNCTRNHVITYILYCKPIACYDDWMTQ